jgi:hypothetical protein
LDPIRQRKKPRKNGRRKKEAEFLLEMEFVPFQEQIPSPIQVDTSRNGKGN